MKIDCNLLAGWLSSTPLTCLDGQQVGDAVQVCQAVLGISRLQLGLSLDGDNLKCSNIETQRGGRRGRSGHTWGSFLTRMTLSWDLVWFPYI